MITYFTVTRAIVIGIAALSAVGSQLGFTWRGDFPIVQYYFDLISEYASYITNLCYNDFFEPSHHYFVSSFDIYMRCLYYKRRLYEPRSGMGEFL